MDVYDDDLLRRLRQLDIIKHGNFELKNKDKSDYYIDLKKAYGYSSIFNDICYKMWREIDERVNCIAAQGYGGSPLASVLAAKNNLRLTLVRESAKTHGRQNIIEGHIPNIEDKIAVVDDVLTTGNTINSIIDAIKPYKPEILGCYVVVKRNDVKLDVPIHYLFTAEQLLESSKSL